MKIGFDILNLVKRLQGFFTAMGRSNGLLKISTISLQTFCCANFWRHPIFARRMSFRRDPPCPSFIR